MHAHAADALRAAAKRVAIGGTIKACRRSARLNRSDDQTLVDEFDTCNMRGFIENAIERDLLLAVRIGGGCPVETDISRRFRPELRRTGSHRGMDAGRGLKRRVIDNDKIGGIVRSRGG